MKNHHSSSLKVAAESIIIQSGGVGTATAATAVKTSTGTCTPRLQVPASSSSSGLDENHIMNPTMSSINAQGGGIHGYRHYRTTGTSKYGNDRS